MAKSHQKNAAARARAGKLSAQRTMLSSSTSDPNVETNGKGERLDDNLKSDCRCTARAGETDCIEISSDSGSDCGYEGGVNNDWHDSDFEDSESSADEWSDSNEELEEISEEDLPPIKVPDIFLAMKTADIWKEAERNRQFGYNGISVRTKFRRAKEAREREEERQKAKVS